MRDQPGKYVVLAEYKSDAPIAYETSLAHADYDTVYERMREVQKNPDVIRVGIARLVYVYGNAELLSPEDHGKESTSQVSYHPTNQEDHPSRSR